MLTVFISGPIANGNRDENYITAVRAAYRLIKAGFAVFCPHAFMPALERIYGTNSAYETDIYNQVQAHDDKWVELCDIVLRLEGKSVGADHEVELARKLRKLVFTNIDVLIADKDVLEGQVNPMTYAHTPLDEIPSNDLQDELERRKALLSQGRCPYCYTSLSIHTCKFSVDLNVFESTYSLKDAYHSWDESGFCKKCGVHVGAVFAGDAIHICKEKIK